MSRPRRVLVGDRVRITTTLKPPPIGGKQPIPAGTTGTVTEVADGGDRWPSPAWVSVQIDTGTIRVPANCLALIGRAER